MKKPYYVLQKILFYSELKCMIIWSILITLLFYPNTQQMLMHCLLVDILYAYIVILLYAPGLNMHVLGNCTERGRKNQVFFFYFTFPKHKILCSALDSTFTLFYFCQKCWVSVVTSVQYDISSYIGRGFTHLQYAFIALYSNQAIQNRNSAIILISLYSVTDPY